MNPAVPTWAGAAASATLVAVTIIVAWSARLDLARDIAIAALRAAVQLVAVGAVLLLVFRHTGLAGAIGWLAAMVLLAGQVAARRANGFPRAVAITTTACALASAATLGTLLTLGVIAAQARVVIPVGGMVVSTAMLAAALVLNRTREEAITARPAIEARLALGLPAADAFAPHQRTTLRTALIPAIDSTKVVGLISLPGAMTGLILAGVDPLTAIRYQIVVMYMLLAAAALAALTTARLAEHTFRQRPPPTPTQHPSRTHLDIPIDHVHSNPLHHTCCARYRLVEAAELHRSRPAGASGPSEPAELAIDWLPYEARAAEGIFTVEEKVERARGWMAIEDSRIQPATGKRAELEAFRWNLATSLGTASRPRQRDRSSMN